MPVINDESTRVFTGSTGGIVAFGKKDFGTTTPKDCDRGNALAWDEIDAARKRIQKLREEALDWLNLRDAIEVFGVETAGELPESTYQRHKKILDRPLIVH